MQEFINRTLYVKAGYILFVQCRTEGSRGLRVPLVVRVPQFGNHCFRKFGSTRSIAFFQYFPALVEELRNCYQCCVATNMQRLTVWKLGCSEAEAQSALSKCEDQFRFFRT